MCFAVNLQICGSWPDVGCTIFVANLAEINLVMFLLISKVLPFRHSSFLFHNHGNSCANLQKHQVSYELFRRDSLADEKCIYILYLL